MLGKVHGIMQVLAFGILLPIGATIAALRNHIGPSWLKLHIAFQLSGTLVALAGLAVIKIATWDKKDEPPRDNHKKWHVVVGPLVMGLLLLELLWAFVGRRMVEWNTWLYVHASLAVLIILGGWLNIYLGWRMTRSSVLL